MFKKLIFILLLISTSTFAKISIGGSGGVLNFGENDEWGWGAGVNTNWMLSERFGISVGLDNYQWDRKWHTSFEEIASRNDYNVRSVSLGVLYFFEQEKYRPYINLKFGKTFTTSQFTFYSYDQYTLEFLETWSGEETFNGSVLGLGGGLSYPLTNKFALDLNLTYFGPSDWASHAKCYVGLFYAF